VPTWTIAGAGVLRLLTLALLWGSNFLWIKLALRGLSPVQIVLVRLSLGALVLTTYILARGRRPLRGTAIWGHLAVAAFFANVIPYLLFAYGEQQVDSAIAGVLNATTPLWTILISTVAGIEKKPPVVKLVGLALGFAGTLVIFNPWRSGSQVMSPGGVACLLAAASYGISYVYMARFLAGRGLSALELAAAQLLAASVLICLAIPLLGWQPPAFRADAIIAALVLGAVGTGVAYVLNYRLITEDGASAASVVTYLIPIVAVVLGALTLQESLPLNVIAGMLVVLLGVALSRTNSAFQHSVLD
jgi:drug/metabolite transporter (DMT)-like permease